MPTRDLERWMWAEACSMLDQAERLQRQFFDPPGRGGPARAWQPPVEHDPVVEVLGVGADGHFPLAWA